MFGRSEGTEKELAEIEGGTSLKLKTLFKKDEQHSVLVDLIVLLVPCKGMHIDGTELKSI